MGSRPWRYYIMIKLQEFLFLFVTEVGDGGVRGNFYFSTDNDTWPKELRHNAITISELMWL